MKINLTIKRIVCLMLALLMLVCSVSCGQKQTKKKKKVVVKKVVVVSGEDNTNEDNSGYNDDWEYSDENDHSIQNNNGNSNGDEESSQDDEYKFPRELATKDDDINSYIPEFTQTEMDWKGPKGYVIVYKYGDKYAKLYANYLQAFFKKYDGVELKVVTDKTAAITKEILVGNTNRYTTKLAENKFAVDLKGQKLVFEGGHRMMVEKAVKWFMSIDRVSGKLATLKGEAKNFKSSLSGGYKLVWGDEFDGNFLDRNKFKYASHMGTGDSAIADDLISLSTVEDGLFKMVTKRVFSDTFSSENIGIAQTVCTGDTMQWLYGYAEIRALVPFTGGAWPAWWATNYCQFTKDKFKFDYKYVVEVDFFEVFGNQNVTPNIHKWYEQTGLGIMTDIKKGDKQYTHSDYNVSVGSISYLMNEIAEKEYHTYGFKWTPEEMVLSVDGDPYMTFDLNNNFDGYTDMSHFKDTPLHMILNNFAYYDTLNVKSLPYNFFVDYVRIYQRDGEGYIKDFGLDKNITYN